MKLKILVIALTASLLGIGSCKQNDPTPNAGEPVVTEPGEPTGAAVSASIGPQGGSLTSADGTVTLQVPAGALDAATTISIQPITNNAPLGVAGGAYRFSPDGQRFKVPAKLTFNYTDEMLGGSSPELFWILTQAADGSWKALLKSSVNAANRTVSGEIKHFSDWVVGKFMDLTLAPESSTLEPGASVQLGVTGFKPTSDDEEDDDLAPIAKITASDEDDLAPIAIILAPEERSRGFTAGQWRLGGEGQLQGNGLSAKYTAPGRVPSRNPVAVSLELEYTTGNAKQKLLLVSNITILEKGVFLLTVDGKEYKTYQNRITLPPDAAGTVTSSFTQDGRGAWYISASSGIAWSFELNMEKPSKGTTSSKLCQPNDDVNVRFTMRAVEYGNGYYERKKEASGFCNVSNLGDGCGPVPLVITLEKFEDKVGGIVSGSFSGAIYENYDTQRACRTSTRHPISGVFSLEIQ